MNEHELGCDSTNIFFSSACCMWYTLIDKTICLLNIVSLLYIGDGKYSLSKLGVISGPFLKKNTMIKIALINTQCAPKFHFNSCPAKPGFILFRKHC